MEPIIYKGDESQAIELKRFLVKETGAQLPLVSFIDVGKGYEGGG